jgi:hypothetical protein
MSSRKHMLFWCVYLSNTLRHLVFLDLPTEPLVCREEPPDDLHSPINLRRIPADAFTR